MKITKTISIIILALLLFSCGDDMKDKYDNGLLYKKWSFDHIEPYNSDDEGSAQAEAFIKRINVTPITINLENASNGNFSAFFPDLDHDLLLSRDFTGEVSFKVNSDNILMSFENVECNSDAEMPSQIFIRKLSEDEMAIEMNGNGILYYVYMKPE